MTVEWIDLPKYQRELVMSTLVAAHDSNLAAAKHYRSIGLDNLAERMESNAAAYDSALDDLGVQIMLDAMPVGDPNRTGRHNA